MGSDDRVQTCPLCGGRAFTSAGTATADRALLSCGCCRTFVIDRRLLDVIANARARNVNAVLRYLMPLTTAARSAAARGTILSITSTNWIRLALGQPRADHAAADAGAPVYARPEADFHSAVAGGRP